MAEKIRYNKIIDLLEQGKPVFSTSTVPNGSLDDLTYMVMYLPPADKYPRLTRPTIKGTKRSI